MTLDSIRFKPTHASVWGDDVLESNFEPGQQTRNIPLSKLGGCGEYDFLVSFYYKPDPGMYRVGSMAIRDVDVCSREYNDFPITNDTLGIKAD